MMSVFVALFEREVEICTTWNDLRLPPLRVRAHYTGGQPLDIRIADDAL